MIRQIEAVSKTLTNQQLDLPAAPGTGNLRYRFLLGSLFFLVGGTNIAAIQRIEAAKIKAPAFEKLRGPAVKSPFNVPLDI